MFKFVIDTSEPNKTVVTVLDSKKESEANNDADTNSLINRDKLKNFKFSVFIRMCLQDYADEMKCGSLTITELIDSHRSLRAKYAVDANDRLQEHKEACARGEERAKEEALARKWVSVEQLKLMTLEQFKALLDN